MGWFAQYTYLLTDWEFEEFRPMSIVMVIGYIGSLIVIKFRLCKIIHLLIINERVTFQC